MTQLDRRSALGLGAAATLLLAASETASAQCAAEAAHNKELLAQRYKRWNESRGDSVAYWMEIIDDNITFGSLAEGAAHVAFTARVNGKQQLKGYMDGLLGGWTMKHFTVNTLVADGDRVVMLGSTGWTNKKNGNLFETPKADVWRFKDGRAVEFYEFYDTAGLAKAAA
jgi:uncharacterized protein